MLLQPETTLHTFNKTITEDRHCLLWSLNQTNICRSVCHKKTVISFWLHLVSLWLRTFYFSPSFQHERKGKKTWSLVLLKPWQDGKIVSF